ncbi:MAG: GAF domain-containing protein [Anaerolineae bacterium]
MTASDNSYRNGRSHSHSADDGNAVTASASSNHKENDSENAAASANANANGDNLQDLRTELEQLKARLSAEEVRSQRGDDELRRAVSEGHAMYLTSLDISGQLELQEILHSILRRALIMLKAELGRIYLIDKETAELVIAADYRHSSDADPEQGKVGAWQVGERLRAGSGITSQVLLTGMPVIANDYEANPLRSERAKQLNIQAVAAVPVRWGTHIIGVMTLCSITPGREFTFDDVESLQRVNVQAAIAIHSAQLSVQERERNRQVEMIYTASTRITETLEPASMMRGIGEALTTALGLSRCVVLEYNPSEGMMVQGDYNIKPDAAVAIAMPGARDSLGNLKPVRDMVRSGQWIVYQRNDPLLQGEVATYMQRWDLQSVLIVPMLVGQRLVGMIILGEGRHLRRFTMSEIGVAQMLANQAGVALRHAQLHQQVQSQRVNEQAVLLQFARHLLELQDMAQVAQQVVAAVVAAFEVRYCDLLIPEDDVLRSHASVGWNRPTAIRLASSQASIVTAVQYAIMMREAVLISDSLMETRFVVPAMIADEGLRSALIVPIAFREELLGLLIIGRHEPHGFDQNDTRLASLLASQAGMALERARLFESVQKYAQQLEAKVADRTLAAQNEQQRMSAIFATTGEELVVLDLDGKIQQVNHAFEQQHGRPAQDLIGRLAEDVLGTDLVTLSRLRDDNGVWRGELPLLRGDGSIYQAAVTLSLINNAHSDPTGVIVSLRDLSYRAEVDRAKSQFVASISHELRTPLTNIKLYLHLLEQGNESRRHQYLATLQRESDRLQALIEGLLTISRLDREQIPMNVRPIDANALVRELMEDRLSLIRQRSLTAESRLLGVPLLILVDEDMVAQAITHLLSNAINYTRPGGTITVATRLEREGENEIVAISIMDTGIGIEEEERDRVFERFYRGKAAEQTGAAGTGLGMSIVKEVVDRLHGRITVESQPESGSTVTLRFPLYRGFSLGDDGAPPSLPPPLPPKLPSQLPG